LFLFVIMLIGVDKAEDLRETIPHQRRLAMALGLVAVGIAIALAMAIRRGDVYFCLVVDWALAGILLKRVLDTTTPDLAFIAAAMTGIVLISAATIMLLALGRVYRPVLNQGRQAGPPSGKPGPRVT